jgi:hypothetical protein
MQEKPVSKIVDDIYLEIAQGIENAISGDWTVAYIFIEILGEATNLKGEYFNCLNNRKFFEVDDSAFDYFENLYGITTESGSNEWNRAQFILYKSGTFEIVFNQINM